MNVVSPSIREDCEGLVERFNLKTTALSTENYGGVSRHYTSATSRGLAPFVAVMKSAEEGQRDDLGRGRRALRDRSSVQ
jgi:hypothetical protein